jgi:hypothetical protein
MKIDTLTVHAQITLKIDSPEAIRLSSMFSSGDKVVGLVDQFPWMPFIVTKVTTERVASTFELKMVGRK